MKTEMPDSLPLITQIIHFFSMMQIQTRIIIEFLPFTIKSMDCLLSI